MSHRLTGVRAVATLADLGLAGFAAGVIARRRRTMALLERAGADTRAVARIHRPQQRPMRATSSPPDSRSRGGGWSGA
ncbi:hypothetical protein ACIA5E_17660 [Nocardia asteroides]|uniref:hypothetical protein n=1 Tax=Nocardia asteroides TaxID=1824 RepID=UPI0037B7E9BB